MSLLLSKPTAEVFVPDGRPTAEALARVTHLGIGAHQDDLEFMAYAGIAECFGRSDVHFAGVTCTAGDGSSRRGVFAHFTDAQMRAARREEQREAARRGGYAAMLQLDYASAELKNAAAFAALAGDLEAILATTKPRVIYAHNPADKHATHTAVFCATLAAVRAWWAEEGGGSAAPANEAVRAPPVFLGCEVWRSLDWLPDAEKVALDCAARPELAEKLFACFASQIAGGKRYDFAVRGRWAANATFLSPHSGDASPAVAYAMDLRPLLVNPALDPAEFVEWKIRRLAAEVRNNLRRLPG